MAPIFKKIFASSAEKLSSLVHREGGHERTPSASSGSSLGSTSLIPSPPLSPPQKDRGSGYPRNEYGRILQQRDDLLREIDEVLAFSRDLSFTVSALSLSIPQGGSAAALTAASSQSASRRPSVQSSQDQLVSGNGTYKRRGSASPTASSSGSSSPGNGDAEVPDLDNAVSAIQKAMNRGRFVRNTLKKLKEDALVDERLGRGDSEAARCRIESINMVVPRQLTSLEQLDAAIATASTCWQMNIQRNLAFLFPVSEDLDAAVMGNSAVFRQMEEALVAQGEPGSALEGLRAIEKVAEKVATISQFREKVKVMATESRALAIHVDRDVSMLL